MFKEPKIINVMDVQPLLIEAGFQAKRLLTRKSANTQKFMLGVGFIEPGERHSWHVHTEGEEEAYYILKGSATYCWQVDGKIMRKSVREGDAVYTPSGLKNQIVNDGTNTLVLVYVISPPRQ